MQLLIAILALPATALLALGSSNKERFWGNLLALLAAPLWLAQEVQHGQWMMMLATGGAIAAHALGIWRLIQPPPHPITDPMVVDALTDDEALEVAMDAAEAVVGE